MTWSSENSSTPQSRHLHGPFGLLNGCEEQASSHVNLHHLGCCRLGNSRTSPKCCAALQHACPAQQCNMRACREKQNRALKRKAGGGESSKRYINHRLTAAYLEAEDDDDDDEYEDTPGRGGRHASAAAEVRVSRL